MTIHKEGYSTIAVVFGALLVLDALVFYFFGNKFMIAPVFSVASFLFFLFIVSFFRMPKRDANVGEYHIIAPADGKVVVVEEAVENEYFKGKRLQVSIFMSPLNVHVNWYPISGKINYYRYHEGAYLVAWHPKSSDENERTTVVIKNAQTEILMRQIAGAVARRVVSYAAENKQIKQGEQLGFIKFGSRVDLFLPIDTKIHVSLNQKVKGRQTVIASF